MQDILQCLSLVQSLLKGQNVQIWRMRKRGVKLMFKLQTRPHERACTVPSSQSGSLEVDKRFVSLANVSEPSKSVPNQNNSSNVLKTEPQLQPRPQAIQPVQHQQIGQPQIITVQDEKGNSVQTQQLIYQVNFQQ